MTDLRDHSQRCDDDPGPYETNGGWWACTRCPGGRDVTINYEAAARWTHAEMVRRGPTDLTWEAAYPEEQADHLFLALGAISAALGDDKTVEELRTAAFDLVAAAIGDTE